MYTLAPRAPPALTPDDLTRLGRSDSGYREAAESISEQQPSFMAREDPNNGALQRRDFGKFVQFFRMSSAYIAGHRGKLFIVCIPGEVCPIALTL